MLNTSNGKRRAALGKGISALIPTSGDRRPDYFACPVDRIRAMHEQPRKNFDETSLVELAGSIERDGMLQPVVVRQDGSDYVIIAGERRWRAAKIAGLEQVPVVLKDATEADAFALALVENLQREDLSPLEMAEACQRLIDEHGYTQEQLAQRIGKSRSAVANTLRLLKLEGPTQAALAHGLLSEGHARQFVGLERDLQSSLLDRVVNDGLSVRETETLARDLKHPSDDGSAELDAGPQPSSEPVEAEGDDVEPIAAESNPAVAEAAELLESVLGVRVDVRDRGGKGTINLHWSSYEALEALVEKLGG